MSEFQKVGLELNIEQMLELSLLEPQLSRALAPQ